MTGRSPGKLCCRDGRQRCRAARRDHSHARTCAPACTALLQRTGMADPHRAPAKEEVPEKKYCSCNSQLGQMLQICQIFHLANFLQKDRRRIDQIRESNVRWSQFIQRKACTNEGTSWMSCAREKEKPAAQKRLGSGPAARSARRLPTRRSMPSCPN